jgi:ribulose kinase
LHACSGTRVILEAFRNAGVAVQELVVAGGVVKNAFLMQLYRRASLLTLLHFTIHFISHPFFGVSLAVT